MIGTLLVQRLMTFGNRMKRVGVVLISMLWMAMLLVMCLPLIAIISILLTLPYLFYPPEKVDTSKLAIWSGKVDQFIFSLMPKMFGGT